VNHFSIAKKMFINNFSALPQQIYLKKLIFSVIDEYEYRDSNSYNDGIFVEMVTNKGDE
jgi:hypothetical protein